MEFTPNHAIVILTAVTLFYSLIAIPIRSKKALASLSSLAAITLALVLMLTRENSTIVVEGAPVLGFEKYGVSMLVLLLVSASLIALLLWRDLDHVVTPIIPWMMYAGILIALSMNPVLLVLGLELGALSVTGIYISYRGSEEAAVKYFFTSLLAGAFLIVGIAFLLSSSIYSFTTIPTTSPSLVLGLAFIVAGLALEVGLAPFHPWLPDVAASAPRLGLSLAILLIDAPTLYVFFRIISAAKATGTLLAWILAILAAASMTIGEFSALVQNNVRRMLGFSMVSDAGYTLLLGVACALSGIVALPMVIYFITSSNMALALAIASTEQRKGYGPIVPALLSLMGLPPFYGFAAKLSVIVFFARTGYAWMAIIASLFFLIAAAYIMRYLMRLSREDILTRYNIFSIIYIILLIILGLYPRLVSLIG